MAVKYKLYQNQREGSMTKGKWYARASYDDSDKVTSVNNKIHPL